MVYPFPKTSIIKLSYRAKPSFHPKSCCWNLIYCNPHISERFFAQVCFYQRRRFWFIAHPVHDDGKCNSHCHTSAMHGLKVRRVDMNDFWFGLDLLLWCELFFVPAFRYLLFVPRLFFLLIMGLWPIYRWFRSFIHCWKCKWYRRKSSCYTFVHMFAHVDDDTGCHVSRDWD